MKYAPKTEEEIAAYSRNPRKMRNRWRARIEGSMDTFAKEKDSKKKEMMAKMLYEQKQVLKKWEERAKK